MYTKRNLENKKNPLQKVITYFVLIIVVATVMLPFIWVLLSSFKSETEIMMNKLSFLPKQFSLRNYLGLIAEHSSSKNFSLNLFNSLKVSLGTTICTVLIATLAGYSLSRYHNCVFEFIAKTIIFIYVFPTIVIIIPIFQLFSSFSLIDSFWGLILIETAFSLPFCIWLLRSFFDAIPLTLEEAAMIDGANAFRSFFITTLPLSASGISAAAIYTFITSWGEYIFSSILLISDDKKTVPLGLATYMTDQYIEWGKLLAGGVIIIIPVLLLFYPLSRYFIRGFMAGAIEK
ncbi:MAG: carbohydrate ABC transporter permease [Bacteroidota bacterium]